MINYKEREKKRNYSRKTFFIFLYLIYYTRATRDHTSWDLVRSKSLNSMNFYSTVRLKYNLAKRFLYLLSLPPPLPPSFRQYFNIRQGHIRRSIQPPSVTFSNLPFSNIKHKIFPQDNNNLYGSLSRVKRATRAIYNDK